MIYSSRVFGRLFAWCIALLVVHPEHRLGIAWLHRRKGIQIKLWDIVMLLVMHDACLVVCGSALDISIRKLPIFRGPTHSLNLYDDPRFISFLHGEKQ